MLFARKQASKEQQAGQDDDSNINVAFHIERQWFYYRTNSENKKDIENV